MNNLHTRRSIGDIHGSRSIYVVEYCNNREKQYWFKVSKQINYEYHEAVDEKIILYQDWKKSFGRKVAWKDFRVALYGRLEKE